MKYPTFAEQKAFGFPDEIREFQERMAAIEKPIREEMERRAAMPQITAIRGQSATMHQTNIHGDTTSVTRIRPQIELTLSGGYAEVITGCAGIRIGGMLFIPLPNGDEILDSEWKTGRIHGT